MSNGIELTVKEKLSVSNIFLLQLDGSYDTSGHAQLIAYIKCTEGKSLKTNFFLY
jgi:hypothetical protein